MEPLDAEEVFEEDAFEADAFEEVNEAFVFERSREQYRRSWWMLLGGIGLVCFGMAGFALAIFSRVGPLGMHAISTLPLILAIGLLSGWWNLSRGPHRVTIDDNGVEIEEANNTTLHPWSEIGWAGAGVTSMGQQKCVTLYDQSGKSLATFTEAFDNFDVLAAALKRRVADQPQSRGGEIQMKKARKSAVFLGMGATAFICLALGLMWHTYDEQQDAKLLETTGIEGEAKIDRLKIAPNGVTTRVEYTVTNEAGESASHNAEVEAEYYGELSATGATTVPVRYVPTDPSISRLQHGEVIDKDFTDTPAGRYGVCILLIGMCLFLWVGAILQWKGLDIVQDKKTGKFSIKRFGEGS